MNRRYSGGCHCGAIRIEFETARPLAPRACQCSFCRKHQARSVSDPEGSAILHVSGEMRPYRFGGLTADYIVCSNCGVYVAAVAVIGGATLATLNVNSFDDPHPQLEAIPVSYDSQDASTKAERRKRLWTPARLLRS